MTDDQTSTRRRYLLTSMAAATAGLAGCSGVLDRSDSPNGTETASPAGTPTGTEPTTPSGTDNPESTPTPDRGPTPGSHEPMQSGAAAFENLAYWSTHAGVSVTGDTGTVYQGSQSARVEGRSGSIERNFQIPLDLSGKDVSLAVKVEKPLPTTVRIILYDTGGNTTHLVQYLHTKHPDGWVRINPSIDSANADPTSISRMLISIDGPGAGKKYWVDDIRFHDKTANKGRVMFTFDYMTRSIYEIAFPMMKQRDIPGAVSVAVDRVGNAGRLTWSELREMQKAGWEITSYTNDFVSLYGQDESIQRRRMQRAKTFIEDNGLGEAPVLMYPDGFCDDTSLRLARELHDLAFLKFDPTETGHTQSAVMGPQFVNRARPNSPSALKNQLDVVADYKSVFNVFHNQLGGDAQNTRSEFRKMLDAVKQRQQTGDVGVALPSDLVLQS